MIATYIATYACTNQADTRIPVSQFTKVHKYVAFLYFSVCASYSYVHVATSVFICSRTVIYVCTVYIIMYADVHTSGLLHSAGPSV